MIGRSTSPNMDTTLRIKTLIRNSILSSVGHKLMLVGQLTKRAPARSLHTAGRSPLRKTANEQELVSDIQKWG